MLVAEGLAWRMWGGPARFGAPLLWAGLVRAAGLELGWPMLVAGFSLIAASFALLIGRRWGLIVGLVTATLAAGYAPAGTVLGLLCLIVLLLPPTRAHLRPQPRLP
jgi:hypothetical protein